MIRPATAADAGAVARIYNHYVRETVVTFEEEPVAEGDMAARISAVQAAGYPWLVHESGGRIDGYAYAARWQSRAAYRHTAECTVYLAPDATGRGKGSALYGALFPLLAALDVHAVVGGIALPNEASVALHEKFGLAKVSHFPEVGFKFGRWIDVGHWQGPPALFPRGR